MPKVDSQNPMGQTPDATKGPDDSTEFRCPHAGERIPSVHSVSSHYATTYGMVQNSCLNSSRYFHVVDRMSPDNMHDILEGVLRVVLILILKDIIIKKLLLWIQQLNDRIETFCYGPIETSNKLKRTDFLI